MRTPWKLVARNMADHWLRSGLTVGALTLALFLFCFVVSIVTTLRNAVDSAADNRLVVQSAVSLFVDLPLDYQAKIEAVPGVEQVTKMQWFGGYHVDESNFFAQFAVDHDRFFDMYAKDIAIVEGPGGVTGPGAREAALEAFNAERRACIVGSGLVRDFGWEVGQTIPLTARIFAKPDEAAWDFVIAGVYEPIKTNVDDRTLWFRWDYFLTTLEEELGYSDMGSGVFMVNTAPGADGAGITRQIDALFENGPQRTATSTEAAFQATFVAMLGSIPEYMAAIGGAIVFAVLFSVVNTMQLAARQRTRSAGILKALGFSDGTLAWMFFAESMLLSVTGGALGVAVAKLTEVPLKHVLASGMPGYAVQWTTLALGLVISVVVGLAAGLGPALSATRLEPVAALRSEG